MVAVASTAQILVFGNLAGAPAASGYLATVADIIAGGSTSGNGFVVTPSTAPLLISNGGALPSDYINATMLEIARSTAGNVRVNLDAFGGGGIFSGSRFNGAIDAPTATQTGQTVAQFTGGGYGTAARALGVANMAIVAAENFTDSAHGSYLTISTTPIGSVTLTEAARFQNDGALSIGQTTTDGVNKLQVTGGAKFDAVRITQQTPASAAASGVANTIAFDTGFIYICTATNTWKRVAIASW